jgi:uncharacterized MAPEG superfamily protein
MTALYCLAFIAFLPIVLALGSIPFRVRQFNLPDIQRPREQAEKLQGAGARIVHAQNNGWEAAILFAITLFIAFQAGVEPGALALPSLLFVVARIIYCVIYLLGYGYTRFFVFLSGIGILFWILALAFASV